MTERERWVVYPLLFLALGAALRDKLVDRTTTKSIVCQELAIVDEETSGSQAPRTLARIGRMEPKSGGKSGAYFQINGKMEVVDGDPSGNRPPRVLINMGRVELPAGAPSTGYVVINGQVGIDGLINARQYVCQGLPFMPWQPIPGGPFPGVLQIAPQAGPKPNSPSAPSAPSPTQPPAKDANKSGTTTPAPAPATGEPPPAK